MKLILLGAPGAGKGTQAEVICEHFHIPAISTGNMIREALKSGTELGEIARSYMESGSLVPDEVVIGIVRDRISQPDCENGFILDGFPRTIAQAEALDAMGADIDRVLNIDVADEAIVARMSGRRVCPVCGASYHLQFKPPMQDNICDRCAGTLIQRQDDVPETVAHRLRVYHEQTKPLEDYYRKQGKLCTVNGQEDVQHTSARILSALEDLK